MTVVPERTTAPDQVDVNVTLVGRVNVNFQLFTVDEEPLRTVVVRQ